MKARDFVPDWLAVAGDRERVEKMNREISHLGWTRKRPGTLGEGWNAREVVRPLAISALKFLREIIPRASLMDFGNNQLRAQKLTARFLWAEGTMPLLDVFPREEDNSTTVFSPVEVLSERFSSKAPSH